MVNSTIVGVGSGKPLQYTCLENSMDREAWRTAVHGGRKDLTDLLSTLYLLS